MTDANPASRRPSRAARLLRHAPSKRTAICLAAGAATVIVTTLLAQSTQPADFAKSRPADLRALPTARVIDILDAQTLIVERDGQSQKLELRGVYLPSRDSTHGRAAHAFLRNLLRGESVYLDLPSDGGSAASPRAFVYRVPDGLFVNLELVRQGYLPATLGDASNHAAEFQHYQDVARAAHKGRWTLLTADPDDDPVDPAESAETPDAAATAPPASAPPASQPGGTVVYVTRSGTKYHLAGCSALRQSSEPVPLDEARRRGYTPCSRCKPPQ